MKESFKKLTRDNRGRFSRSVWGARLCALILAILALLYIYSFYKQMEYKNFKFVSPIVESKESDYKVKFLEDYKTSDMEVLNMIVAEFEDQGAKVVKEALDIAYAESRFVENNTHYNFRNSTWDIGVFMINDCHGLSKETRLAAYENIHFAKQLYKKQGWQPWVMAHRLRIVK